MCVQEKKNLLTIEQTGSCNISSYHYLTDYLYPIYFFVYTRKQAPVNRAQTFTIVHLDYLDRDSWVEITRRSHPAQSNLDLYPINPVYSAETININTNKEHLLRTMTGLKKNTKFLLYFNFTQKSTAVQEINFLVATCFYTFLPVTLVSRKTYYQLYQKQVHLFSHEPGYLISTISKTDTITINNITGSIDGTLIAYITAAPRLESQDGSRYNVCSDLPSNLKRCLLHYQDSTRLYVYYVLFKYRSWNEASDYCKARGGFLPIVRSREEQADIIRIFNKYGAEHPEPIFGIYLGLRLHKVDLCVFCNEVHKFSLVWA